MSTSAVAELYCVLIAIEGDTLLLPKAVVAETLGPEILQQGENQPPGVVGRLDWNQRVLTALSFEQLNSGSTSPLSKRARLVVLNELDADSTQPPLVLLGQGYPHLITVNRNAITPLPLRAGDHPELVLTRVRIGNGEALIPDLDALRTHVEAFNPR